MFNFLGQFKAAKKIKRFRTTQLVHTQPKVFTYAVIDMLLAT